MAKQVTNGLSSKSHPGAGSVAAGTLMSNLLFAVSSWDVPTLVSVAVVLAISGLIASYLPARRAAAVNPVEALRAD